MVVYLYLKLSKLLLGDFLVTLFHFFFLNIYLCHKMDLIYFCFIFNNVTNIIKDAILIKFP